jgi:predicted CoA-binding protein
MSKTIYEELEAGIERLLGRVAAHGGLPEVKALLQQAKEQVRASARARPSVAVVGASGDRSKYGNKAVRAFMKAGYDVYPVNPNVREVEGLTAYPNLAAVPVDRLDRVSFYVPPEVGLRVLEQVGDKPIGELWLNPGADAAEVVERAEMLGLSVVRACSILAVGENPDRV